MLKRTLTSFVILLLTAGCVALKLVSAYFFDAFVFVLIYASVIEMCFAFKVAGKHFFKLPLLLLPIVAFLSFKFTNNPFVYILAGWLALAIYSVIFELIINSKLRNRTTPTTFDEENERRFGITKTTLFICAYPVSILSLLFGLNALEQNLSFIAIILTFAVAMMTDVFAYCFGVMLGKNSTHKLAPEISPKKSIVGSVFGVVGGLIVGGLGFLFFYHLGWLGGLGTNLAVAIAVMAIIGVIGSLATQVGDLFASAFKRKIGIKDFGNIFPGHGGFMDRLDGLMFAGAVVYLCFAILV
ncbi:MAG: phosphatidate cytidylyltransferase [Clostridia bacterium]|nr:phosphatidate cytidylyltransferase [Clostridia bacterium]